MRLSFGDNDFMTTPPFLKWSACCAAVAIALLATARIAAGRASDPPDQAAAESAQQSQPNSSATNQNTAHEEATGTSNDRLFYALPDFLTIQNANDVPPLSAKQKFAVVARSSFDYVEYPWYAALAGISQAENSEPAYGQGAAGYGKRYGTAFADGTIENSLTSSILPSMLHEDPRFYQMPNGGFTHRAAYAASRILVTRSDSGHRQINFSEILGSLMAATISTYSYHPRSERTIANASSVWGSEVGYDTITIGVKEFWPDIQKKFARHKRANDPAGQSDNTDLPHK